MLLREIAMTTHSVFSHENALGAGFASYRTRILDTLRLWRKRMHTRRELAALSDIELRDIGYPAAAQAEIHKPFWRA
jgi:uncharacterized protein YjiS (DUF1127 family)